MGEDGVSVKHTNVFVEAECANCGVVIAKYRWEEDSGYRHMPGAYLECHRRTRAVPKPGSVKP